MPNCLHRPRLLSAHRWQLLRIVACCLFVGLIAVAPAAQLAAAEPAAPVVRLVVDYGDGVQVHFTALKWRDGMSALDALAAAKAHAHGISFVQRGSGTGAFVTQIGDLKNEGNGKNWIYYVNDKSGDESAAVHKLKADDAVLWKFELYQYNE